MDINKVVDLLHNGAVIAYPTEGVWGLGCDPLNEEAVLKLLRLKQRAIEKGMILVTDKAERFVPYIQNLAPFQKHYSVQKLNSGKSINDQAITWIVEHGGMTPDWLSGGRATIAVRISSHPVICSICESAEIPLVSTSANPSGEPAAKTEDEVRSYFGNLIDIIVPGDLGGQNGASEIRDFATGKVLREAEK